MIRRLFQKIADSFRLLVLEAKFKKMESEEAEAMRIMVTELEKLASMPLFEDVKGKENGHTD